MSEWQPIETAPKDGTRVLGYSRADGPHVWWWVRYIVGGGDRGSWENVSYEWEELDQPTHWQPLPAPPLHNTDLCNFT